MKNKEYMRKKYFPHLFDTWELASRLLNFFKYRADKPIMPTFPYHKNIFGTTTNQIWLVTIQWLDSYQLLLYFGEKKSTFFCIYLKVDFQMLLKTLLIYGFNISMFELNQKIILKTLSMFTIAFYMVYSLSWWFFQIKEQLITVKSLDSYQYNFFSWCTLIYFYW